MTKHSFAFNEIGSPLFKSGETTMTIRAILNAKPAGVATIPPTATIVSAADRMLEAHVGTLVVTVGGEITALISERDIVSAVSRHGSHALEMEVRDVARRGIVTTSPVDSAKRAMCLMTWHRVRHLPVLENGRLVGIVSLGDVIKHQLKETQLEANILRDVAIAVH